MIAKKSDHKPPYLGLNLLDKAVDLPSEGAPPFLPVLGGGEGQPLEVDLAPTPLVGGAAAAGGGGASAPPT